MHWIAIVSAVLDVAPKAISVVERLFNKGDNDTKKTKAAKEVLELIKENIDEGNWDMYGGFLSEVDQDVLLKAIEDEAKFTAEISKVNDALVGFSNYLRTVSEEMSDDASNL